MTWPGPAALGRSVIVAGEQPPPGPWAGCDEVVVEGPSPAVVAALHDAWAARTPVVVRLLIDPASFRAAVHHRLTPLEAGVAFDALEDRLHHLVWANAYDARGAAAEEPVWWWSRKAARLGADEGGPADVVLPDGRPAWVDGGPRQPFDRARLDGHLLVHRDSVDLGSLRVVPEPAPPVAALAPDQLAAVAHGAGPARIVAPAGSGKTRVLTERVRHLVRDRGYEPGSLLAVAFNVRAKQEMEARLSDVPGVRVQTLNGLGWWVLREARGRDLRVLGERDVRDVVGRLVQLPPSRRKANTDPISPYLDGLSRIRLGLREAARVEGELDGEADGLAEHVWPEYRSALIRAGGVDFDEQVYGAVEALLQDGDLRRRLQDRCRHLLVDELQDLTPCHLLLVRLLASPGLDVFGVGDDDQVLYSYMGATPRFLIDFDRWFPGGAAHPLTTNHRCPAAVTTAADVLLRRNEERVAKEIVPGPAADPDPACFGVRRHASERAAAELLDVVGGWLAEGVQPSAVAVLARVGSLLLAPQVALGEAGVPVASDLGEEVLKRTGVQAALAYLRLAADPSAMSGADVAAILKRPSRGSLPQWLPDRLGRRRWSARALRQLADELQRENEQRNLRQVADDLDRVAKAAREGVRAALVAVRDDVGLGQAMGLLDSSKGGQGGSNVDDLEALLQLADLHDEVNTFEAWLRSHLARPSAADGVTLATVHRVKGQEWDRVVLFGVTDGVSPHRLTDDVEEERRIVHVGITRCRHAVVVLGDAGRPSGFLDELEGRDPPRPLRRPAPASATTPARAASAPPKEAPATPMATAEVGRSVVVGGSELQVVEVGRDGVLLQHAGGAKERLPWGSTVQAEGQRAALVHPRRAEVVAAVKAWRTAKAKADAKPAYVFLTDATVELLATSLPANLIALRTVPGIGPAKLDAYGEDVLEAVRVGLEGEAPGGST